MSTATKTSVDLPSVLNFDGELSHGNLGQVATFDNSSILKDRCATEDNFHNAFGDAFTRTFVNIVFCVVYVNSTTCLGPD